MDEEGDGVGRMKREMECGDGGRWSGDEIKEMEGDMEWEG